jgi:hypothetical protein
MPTLLGVLAVLIGIPLVGLGLVGIILGACWYGSETGGFWMGVGIYGVLLGSPPCYTAGWALLRQHNK